MVRVRGGRQIRDEGQAARIHCPGELVLEGGKRGKCNILVDEAVVEKLLKAGPAPDTALLSKYRKRLVEGSAPFPPPPAAPAPVLPSGGQAGWRGEAADRCSCHGTIETNLLGLYVKFTPA